MAHEVTIIRQRINKNCLKIPVMPRVYAEIKPKMNSRNVVHCCSVRLDFVQWIWVIPLLLRAGGPFRALAIFN